MRSKVKAYSILGLCAAIAASAAMLGADQNNKKVAKVGEAAPLFTLTDTEGKEFKLEDYEGKIIVLEWFNPQCPYVIDQHEQGPLKDLGNKLEKDGVEFFAINSNPTGSPGSGADTNAGFRKQWKMEYPVLMDEDGTVARLYDARRTPHMFVINSEGTLVYAGAIDNAPMGRPKPGQELMDYVQNAVDQLRAGETVAPDKTEAYGCTVKATRN